MADKSIGNVPESVLLYLIGGREIRLGVNPKEWADAVDNALRKNEIIHIENVSSSSEGDIGINPRAILYWKYEPGPAQPS